MAATPQALPAEANGPDRSVWLLSALVVLLPAVGVPAQEMLQDTLKSLLAALVLLAAAGLFAWGQRHRREPLRWHGVLWGPLALCAWALGSMAWSHAYLGGVEAIRWALFSLLLWLGLNTLARERLPLLAQALHAGAVVAALWAGLQFWVDWRFFPQGPVPASTFVNRNFFAEYVVCVLPFSALLLAQARGAGRIAWQAASLGFLVVAVFMTGTRSALIAMALQVVVAWPLAAWRLRGRLACSGWSHAHRALAAGLVLATVGMLGHIPTGNPQVHQEGRGDTPIARAIHRGQAIGPSDPSLNIRMAMWRDTLRMAAAHPLAGVGAGAWEVQIPRYQRAGTQLETDFYAHNEFLQLLAEYGLVGWAFLLAGIGYLLRAAWRTLRIRQAPGEAMEPEAPWRAAALASLLSLAVVSQAGFAWRLAGTGVVFALALAILAASDARLGPATRFGPRPLRWSRWRADALFAVAFAGLALTQYIGQQAAASEARLVRAARLAIAINASGRPQDARWAQDRAEILDLAREGIAINRHYRKITPVIADELARWGDWQNATWIWESVLSSRPYVVAILSNAARGHVQLGDLPGAWALQQRAQALQPDAPAVRSLEVVLLAKSGQEARAIERARQALAAGIVDPDLVRAALLLARKFGDAGLEQRALALAAVQGRP